MSTGSFPRFRFLPTVTNRLQRDFARHKARRTERKQGLTTNEEEYLDSYEYQLTKVWENCGAAGLDDVFKDLASVLGVNETEIKTHYRPLVAELKDPPSKRPTITRDSTGLHITFNLGDLISKEVDARLSQLTARDTPCNTAIQTIDLAEEAEEALGDSDSVLSIPSPRRVAGQWDLQLASVQSVSGTYVTVSYVNDLDTAPFPTNWRFLYQNEGSEEVPARACRCNPSATNCRESRTCPCAQLNLSSNPSGLSLYSGKGTLKKLSPAAKQVLYECTVNCTCAKETCPQSYLVDELEQLQERSFAVVRRDGPTWTSLVTLEAIGRDEFVLEVTGEVLSSEELAKREAQLAAPLFAIPLLSKFLDTSAKGNLSRFLSHNCEPSLTVTRTADQHSLRVLLFSSRALVRGDELTVNMAQLWLVRGRLKCECGAKTCKGFIGTS